MRHSSSQLPLTAPWIANPHAVELAAMSALLDEQPVLSAVVPTPSKSALAETLRRVSPRILALLDDQTVTRPRARSNLPRPCAWTRPWSP